MKSPWISDWIGSRRLLIAAMILSFVLGGGIGSLVTHQVDQGSITGAPSTTTTIASTPDFAIDKYLALRGHAYIGNCSKSKVPVDVGKYCAALKHDDGVIRTYLVGPVASEGELYVLARNTQGWRVVFVTVTPPLIPTAPR